MRQTLWRADVRRRRGPHRGRPVAVVHRRVDIRAKRNSLLHAYVDGCSHGEIAERLEGMGVADFYGAYLDEQLAIARRVVAGA